MEESSPGPSNTVQLVPSAKTLTWDFDFCIICQKEKDRNGTKKISSTANGQQIIISTSAKIEDGIYTRIAEEDHSKIKYHVKTCYATYRKKGKRPKRKTEEVETPDNEPKSPPTRAKRSKQVTSPDPRDKPCIICNHKKHHGQIKRHRIESYEVAQGFLKSTKFFNDDVRTRTIFLAEIGDVWAADLMYHKNCMIKYFINFERDVVKLLNIDFGSQGQRSCIKETFKELAETLDIGLNGYAVSDVRDTLNKKLDDFGKL